MTVRNLKTRLQRISNYLWYGVFENERSTEKRPYFQLYLWSFRNIGCFIDIVDTPYGSGVNPDSITYFGAAKSILSGQGYLINGFQRPFSSALFFFLLQ